MKSCRVKDFPPEIVFLATLALLKYPVRWKCVKPNQDIQWFGCSDLHIPLKQGILGFLRSVVQGFGLFASSSNCISVVNEMTQILGTGMYVGNTLAYKIIHALPWGMGNGSCLFAHFLICRKTWRKYIQTKGIRETPFVVSVVNDGKLSLGDFYSILCKGCNLDQGSWFLL